jgi:hypothetical protein
LDFGLAKHSDATPTGELGLAPLSPVKGQPFQHRDSFGDLIPFGPKFGQRFVEVHRCKCSNWIWVLDGGI